MVKPDIDHIVNLIVGVFQNLDKDKNGEMSKEELVGAFFHLLDGDGDGEVTFKELWRLVRQYAAHSNIKLAKGWTRRIYGAFRSMDTNRSGSITLKEFITWLKRSRADISDFKKAVESLKARPG